MPWLRRLGLVWNRGGRVLWRQGKTGGLPGWIHGRPGRFSGHLGLLLPGRGRLGGGQEVFDVECHMPIMLRPE